MLIAQTKHIILHVLKYTLGWLYLAIFFDGLEVFPLIPIAAILMCSWVSYETDIIRWHANRLVGALATIGEIESDGRVESHLNVKRLLWTLMLASAGIYALTYFTQIRMYGETAFYSTYFMFAFWLSLDLAEYREYTAIYAEHQKLASELVTSGKLQERRRG